MSGFSKRLANDRNDRPQVLAGGEFGHDPTIGVVSGNLGSDHIGNQLLARAHYGRRSFVAGTLDTEDVGVGHLPNSIEILMADLIQHPREPGFALPNRWIHLLVGGSELHGAKVHGTDDHDIYGI